MARKIVLIGIFITSALIGAYSSPIIGEDDLLCEICHRMVKDLNSLIAENSTQSEIEGHLNDICDRLAGAQDKCRSMVQSSLPSLMDKLVNKINPEDVCLALKVCPGISEPQSLPREVSNTVLSDVVPSAKEEISNVILKEDANPTICNLCQLAVQSLDVAVAEKTDELNIEQTLDKFCKRLPSEYTDECNTFKADLLKELENGFDPAKACAAIKLCNSASRKVISLPALTCEGCQDLLESLAGQDGVRKCFNIPGICSKEAEEQFTNQIENNLYIPTVVKVEEQNQEEVDASFFCEICAALVDELDIILHQNRTIIQINSTLRGLCDDLPGQLADFCDGYEEKLLEALIGGVNSTQACTYIGVCQSNNNNEKFRTEIKELVHEDTPLEAGPAECDICKLLMKEADKYLNNTSPDKLNETLMNFCDKIPALLQPFCKKYEPLIVGVVTHGVDPTKVCQEIKLCDANRKEIEDIKAGPAECEICKLLITEAVKYLNNTSPDKLNETLMNFCDKMPAVLQPFCKEYEPLVVGVVTHGVDPTKACQKIKLCDAAKDVKKLKMKKLSANPVECELCKVVLTAVDNYVKQNGTGKRLNDTLFHICEKIPAALKSFCLQYEPEIIDILQNGLDPATACQKIELCDASNDAKKLKIKQLSANPVECELCKVVLTAVDNYVKQNGTGKRLNDTLFHICEKIPAALKSFCLQYEPEIIDILQNGLDPATACQKIELCDSSKLETPVAQRPYPKGNPINCELCKLVINAVDNYVKQNGTGKKLNDTMFKICDKIPAALKPFCDQYEPEIIDVIQNGLDPATACQKIQLCASFRREHFEDITAPSTTTEPVQCTLCKFLLVELNKTINLNSTKGDINNTLSNLCQKYFPDVFLKRLCETSLPDIEHAIEYRMFNANVACTLAGICDSPEYTVLRSLSKSTEERAPDAKCELCKFMIQLIDKNINKETINSTVYSICNSIPDETLKQQCLSFAPVIVNAIKAGVDPQSACVAVEMCPAKNTAAVSSEVDEEQEEEAFKEFVGQEQTEIPSNLKDFKCQACEFVVTFVDEELKNNKTTAAVNTTVYKLCDTLPTTLKVLCKSAAPELVKLIEGGFNSTSACKMVGLCSSENKKTIAVAPEVVEEEEPTEEFPIEEHEDSEKPIHAQDFKCEMCELIITLVDKDLGNNKSEAAVNATIYKLCDTLPSTLKVLCKTAAPELDKLIVGGFNASRACQLVGLCSNSSMIMEPVLVLTCQECHGVVEMMSPLTYSVESGDIKCAAFCHKRSRRSIKKPEHFVQNLINSKQFKKVAKLEKTWRCLLCEFIVEGLDDFLKDNKTDKDIINYLQGVCKFLPSPYKEECSRTSTFIVKELSHGADTKLLCKKIFEDTDDCANDTLKFKSELSETKYKADNWECESCKLIVQFIADNVEKDYDKVKLFLDDVCGHLPNPTNKACLKFADTKAQEVIEKILNKIVNPGIVCEMVKICPKH